MLTLLCPSCDCYYWLSRWKDLESLRSQASGHVNKLFSWVELIEVGRQTVNDGSTLPWTGVLEKMRGKKPCRTWAVVSLYSGMYGFPCFIFFFLLSAFWVLTRTKVWFVWYFGLPYFITKHPIPMALPCDCLLLCVWSVCIHSNGRVDFLFSSFG